MTDRPRPQYGEYASPEEQSQASGVPATSAAPVEPVTPAQSASPLPPLVEYSPPRTWDRVLTAILIGIGAYTVINYISTLPQLGALISQTFQTVELGDFQRDALADQWGMAAMIAIIVLYALSTTLALLSLRAARVSFWIPLVAGALAFVLVMVIVSVLGFTDPGYQAFVESVRPE